MAETPPSTEPGRSGHEVRDVNSRRLVYCGIGLVALVVVSLALMDGLFDVFAAYHTPSAVPLSLQAQAPPPPGPRLQIAPSRDLHQMRLDEEAVLSSYGWVNQAAGIVRMPIDRAMRLLAERGLPARSAPQRTQEQGKPGGQP